jgi:hypothetical protein
LCAAVLIVRWPGVDVPAPIGWFIAHCCPVHWRERPGHLGLFDQLIELLTGETQRFGLVAQDVSSRLFDTLAELVDPLSGASLDLLGLRQQVTPQQLARGFQRLVGVSRVCLAKVS